MDMNSEDINQFIYSPDDPRLFSNVSQAISLVDLGKKLLDASRNGDVDEVRNLINGGAPFTTDWLGFSPLHFAAMNGHLTTCEALLTSGISRDARTKVDRTPLHLAAQEGHADIVELLLKSGADLEAVDTLKMTALHWAAERGHYPVVQVLMRCGANIHLQNKFEMTPLEIAEYHGHVDAKDAMLTTQVEVNPAVGKMAAPNEDLADPNAFIITDEETVIPAAPPADEVVISSVKEEAEEEEPEDSHQQASRDTVVVDPLLNEGSKQTLTEWVATDEKAEINDNEASQTSFPPLSPSTDQYFNPSSKPFDVQLMDSMSLPLQSQESINTPSTSNPPNAHDNTLLVETPEGTVLYVRQEEDTEHGSKLAIFDKDGEPIVDEKLVSQVVNALANYPGLDQTDNTQLVSGLGEPLDTNNLVRDPELPRREDHAETVDREALLSQIIQFATDVERMGSSLCVDGLPDLPDEKAIVSWCNSCGLTVTEFVSFNQFTVSFENEGSTFFLNASYDSDYGSITFNNRAMM